MVAFPDGPQASQDGPMEVYALIEEGVLPAGPGAEPIRGLERKPGLIRRKTALKIGVACLCLSALAGAVWVLG